MSTQIAYTFEVEGPSSSVLQPASKRELLAALLGMLRDTSWARAVGCPAEPAFMLPITCATALKPNILTSQVSAWRDILSPCLAFAFFVSYKGITPNC